MTNQHPLTDDFCHRIAESWPPDAAEKDNMRSAADWQLEQVIEWIRENLTWIEEDGLPRYLKNSSHEECAVIDEWKVISDLKLAMRPQEDNS